MHLQQIGSSLIVVLSLIQLINGQGPFPPRLSIPGAIPVSGPIVSRPVVRVRRPIALRAQNVVPPITPRIVEDKPVTESSDDEAPDVYLPTLLREQQQQQFQQAAAAFLQNEPNSISEAPIVQFLHHDEPAPPARFNERPIPSKPVSFNDYGIGSGLANSQRFGLERVQTTGSLPQPAPAVQSQPTPQRTNVVRTRPTQNRIQYEQPQPIQVQTPTSRPRPKPIQSRPLIDQNQIQDEREQQNRRQRPVAQTIRKWREENEDGSITWGYENDDGSFKEELIGTDCITKGTYGYVDPDGNKREYHYETGIKCDPNAKEPEEEDVVQGNAYVNYEDNKAILPNGLEIDMTKLSKKSRRPAIAYRP